jgi:hypothetical protein
MLDHEFKNMFALFDFFSLFTLMDIPGQGSQELSVFPGCIIFDLEQIGFEHAAYGLVFSEIPGNDLGCRLGVVVKLQGLRREHEQPMDAGRDVDPDLNIVGSAFPRPVEKLGNGILVDFIHMA